MAESSWLMLITCYLIAVFPIYNELAYNEFCIVPTKNNLLAKLVLSFHINSSDIMFLDITIPHLYQIKFCVIRRASSSGITFWNVHADIRAEPVVHSGQRPYSFACVSIQSLLWAWERTSCSHAEHSHFQLIRQCWQQLNSDMRSMESYIPEASHCTEDKHFQFKHWNFSVS